MDCAHSVQGLQIYSMNSDGKNQHIQNTLTQLVKTASYVAWINARRSVTMTIGRQASIHLGNRGCTVTAVPTGRILSMERPVCRSYKTIGASFCQNQ
jgi:hypothetical protein